MALREKFGKLVLLDETEASAFLREYRAARLGPAGLDRLVTVLRFGPAVSSHAEATKRLMDGARLAARLQNPGLVRVLGIGRVEQSFYVSTELVEGRSLAAVLERCRSEAFPFAAEQALMVASRAASTLEALHGKRDDAGLPLVHGLVSPSRIMVAFDGEVKLKGLGLWAALGGTDLLPPDERRYLAPEQEAGDMGEARSDVYALGLVLLESLTGRAPDGADPVEGLAAASITSAAGERKPLPEPLGVLLRRALGRAPAERFTGMAELRKAIDALVFSGDFAPTTFDLAFFMHTLFRDDMEREARALEEARRADYREFLGEEKPAAPVSRPATAAADTGPARPVAPDSATAAPRSAEGAAEAPPPTPVEARPPAPERPLSAPGLGPDVSGPRPATTRASRESAAREAAARMTLGGATAATRGGRRGLWLALALLAVALAGTGVGFMYFSKLRRPPQPPAPSAEALAAQARIRELEDTIARLEREKAEAETQAADEARRTVEAQAAARGKIADPATIARAQEEARQRARIEQEQKQQEEMRRLAEERAAEVRRLAAQATPLPVATPTPAPPATPTPLPTATPTPRPAVPPAATPTLSERSATSGVPIGGVPPGGPAAATTPASPAPTPGREIADPSDPTVKPPVFQFADPVPYPRNALRMRVSTSVTVRALIDERGRVAEATILRGSGQPAAFGFDETALRGVRSRRYRPAQRQGVPVAMWVIVRIDFRPPPP
jgi:TonB family protein